MTWHIVAWVCVVAAVLSVLALVVATNGCKLYTKPYRVTTAPTVIITGSVPVDEDGGPGL